MEFTLLSVILIYDFIWQIFNDWRAEVLVAAGMFSLYYDFMIFSTWERDVRSKQKQNKKNKPNGKMMIILNWNKNFERHERKKVSYRMFQFVFQKKKKSVCGH